MPRKRQHKKRKEVTGSRILREKARRAVKRAICSIFQKNGNKALTEEDLIDAIQEIAPRGERAILLYMAEMRGAGDLEEIPDTSSKYHLTDKGIQTCSKLTKG